MNIFGNRLAPLCLSASASALLASAAAQASAGQVHRLHHGETVAAVARKFHVSVHAIAAANPGIDVDSVPDGHRLVIPGPGHHHKASDIRLAHSHPSHRRVAYTRGDHVGLRRGPGERFHRLGACWKGEKLIVSAVKDGWAHVTTAGGASGWMRHDFLKYAHTAPAGALTLAAGRHARLIAAAKHRAHLRHLAAAARLDHAHRHAHIASKGSGHHALHLARAEWAGAGRRHYALSREHDRGDGNSVVGTAIAYRGTPYRYGSSGGGSFDCSGFTRFVYGRKGVSLPHSAKEQFHQGHHVSRADLKPGDLVFFHTVTTGISHVGIYAGNGKFVHASSRRSGGVRVDRLDSGYYSGAFRGARRVK